jgi:hypothetical protein
MNFQKIYECHINQYSYICMNPPSSHFFLLLIRLDWLSLGGIHASLHSDELARTVVHEQTKRILFVPSYWKVKNTSSRWWKLFHMFEMKGQRPFEEEGSFVFPSLCCTILAALVSPVLLPLCALSVSSTKSSTKHEKSFFHMPFLPHSR